MGSLSHPQPDLSDLSAYRIPNLPPNFYYIPSFLSLTESASLVQKIPSNRWLQLTHRRLQALPAPLTKNNVLLSSALPPWLVDPVLPRFKQLGVFEHTPHGKPNHCLVNEYKPGEGIMPHEDGPAYADVVATVSLGGTVVLELWKKEEAERKETSEAEAQNDTAASETSNGGAGDEAKRERNREVDREANDDQEGVDTRPRPLYRILQEPGSLLVTTADAYTSLLHGISPITVDTNLSRDTVANWDQLGDSCAFASGSSERMTRTSLTYRDVLKVSNAGQRILGKR